MHIFQMKNMRVNNSLVYTHKIIVLVYACLDNCVQFYFIFLKMYKIFFDGVLNISKFVSFRNSLTKVF
jgi:hypothetical protein